MLTAPTNHTISHHRKRMCAATRGSFRFISIWILTLVSFVLSANFALADNDEADIKVRIGVNALRGTEKCLKQWTPMASYLSQQVPGYTYEIVPISLADIPAAVAAKTIDFVMTNPSSYVELEANYGVIRLATLRALRQGIPCTVFGGVIFTRADRADITTLDDLHNKIFATAAIQGFGAFRTAWRELLKNGIDPFEDFAEVKEVGFPQDNAIYAVLDGTADAGTVRTDMIERLVSEGKIKLDQIRVLNRLTDKRHPEYPFAYSTPLYPEWPFSTLEHTSVNLARVTVLVLLTMSEDAQAAKAANIAGWTVPEDYHSVHECLKELRVGPYINYGKVTIYDVISAYWHWMLLALGIFLIIACGAVYVWRLNKKLTTYQDQLHMELEIRHLAEKSLDKAQKKTQLILNSAGEGICGLDTQGNTMFVNPAAGRMLGYEPVELLTKSLHESIQYAHTDDAKFDSEQSAISKTLQDGQICEVDTEVFWRKDGSQFPVKYVCTPIAEDGYVVGAVLTFSDITRRLENEKEREILHDKLIDASRSAGMAEVAIDVLHNVGNVLNSVNVAVNILHQKVSASKISGLTKTVDLLAKNSDHLGEFITIDEIGSRVPRYLAKLSKLLEEDRKQQLTELENLSSHVNHINLIVQAQQNYTKLGGVIQTVTISELLDEAITIQKNSLDFHDIEPLREYENIPTVEIDKHDVLQILTNLISNADDALFHSSQPDKQLTLKTSACGENRIRIEVSDNGVGIEADKLDRIFTHGFTTKESGNGFGLHSAANLAGKLGGSLTVTSEGVNLGATFTLELPIHAARNATIA